MQRNPRFIVVEPQVLVQMDLVHSLQEVCPHATVAPVSSLAAAEQAIAGWKHLTGAVIGVEPKTFRSSGLGPRIRALGGWIICIDAGDTPSLAADGWRTITRPVFSDDLRQLVRSLMSPPEDRSAAC